MSFKRILPVIPLIASIVFLLRPDLSPFTKDSFSAELIVLTVYSAISTLGMTKDYYSRSKVSMAYILSICLCQLGLAVIPIIRLIHFEFISAEHLISVAAYSILFALLTISCGVRLFKNHISIKLIYAESAAIVIFTVVEFLLGSSYFTNYVFILLIDLVLCINTFMDFYPYDFLIVSEK